MTQRKHTSVAKRPIGIDGLSDRDRAVLDAHDLRLPLPEIAENVGITLQQVRSVIYRWGSSDSSVRFDRNIAAGSAMLRDRILEVLGARA